MNGLGVSDETERISTVRRSKVNGDDDEVTIGGGTDRRRGAQRGNIADVACLERRTRCG